MTLKNNGCLWFMVLTPLSTIIQFDFCYRSEAVSPALSEQEFEEIFQRNKTPLSNVFH
jgi:hypothetical protein